MQYICNNIILSWENVFMQNFKYNIKNSMIYEMNNINSNYDL